ncbi:MAG: inositol monophosphatase family protein [Candidatus Hydrogenedentota bacterium]
MTWDAELDRAVNAAKAAGQLLLDAMSGARAVLSAKGKDIKLQADQDAENVILDALSSSDYPVLAEESGEHGDTQSGGPMWIVDPLDGTMNFKRGIPICCVSIGLMQGDEPILGVIYDFNRDDLYTGIMWQGAFLNGKEMSVSDVETRCDAVISTGFPVSRDYSSDAVLDFVRYVQSYKKVRFLGSAAMSLAWVASGCVDACVEEDVMLWDVAAGAAIVQAAGGYVELLPSDSKPWARKVRAVSRKALLEDEA